MYTTGHVKSGVPFGVGDFTLRVGLLLLDNTNINTNTDTGLELSNVYTSFVCAQLLLQKQT